MDKISMIIQGKTFPGTENTAKKCAELPFIDEIIISCWEGDIPIKETGKIKTLYNKPIVVEGVSTFNYQLHNSLHGIKAASNSLCIKTRSDQDISKDSWIKLYNYFNKYKTYNMIPYLDRTYQLSNVFVIGLNQIFPFHPQDHMFWGHQQDLIKIFDIPQFPTRKEWKFDTLMREPIHLGSNYYSKFDKNVLKCINDPLKYLVDGAPQHNEAMDIYNRTRDKVFKVFPKIDMYWEKYGWNQYPYQGYAEQGEYYAEDLNLL